MGCTGGKIAAPVEAGVPEPSAVATVLASSTSDQKITSAAVVVSSPKSDSGAVTDVVVHIAETPVATAEVNAVDEEDETVGQEMADVAGEFANDTLQTVLFSDLPQLTDLSFKATIDEHEFLVHDDQERAKFEGCFCIGGQCIPYSFDCGQGTCWQGAVTDVVVHIAETPVATAEVNAVDEEDETVGQEMTDVAGAVTDVVVHIAETPVATAEVNAVDEEDETVGQEMTDVAGAVTDVVVHIAETPVATAEVNAVDEEDETVGQEMADVAGNFKMFELPQRLWPSA